MTSLSSELLAVVFVFGAAATWVAGVSLSKTTDALDARLGLGEDLGGSFCSPSQVACPSPQSPSRPPPRASSEWQPDT